MIDVSIILVSYNTKDLTKNCLKSIYEKTQNIDFDVFVVDNSSTDGSVEMIQNEFPQVHLIKNKENKGFGAANNIAIKQSKAKYIFCLNTDTILLNNSAKIFFDFMEKEQNQNVGACGGIMLDADGHKTYLEFKFPSLLDFSFLIKNKKNNQDLSKNKEVDWMGGANLFLRKSCLESVGLFDENFFMYFEETDLCKRIKNHGFRIFFVPESVIIHYEGASFGKNNIINFEKTRIFAQSKCYYFKKHYGNFSVIIIKILYIFSQLSKFIKNKNKDELKVLKIKLEV